MHDYFSQLISTAVERFSPRTLYVVATPIGNLADISARAIAAFQAADIICAEDTRVSSHLLAAYGISAKLVSLREHNEQRMAEQVIRWLMDDKIVLQVSDAGTPCISDPGAKLVAAVWAAGLRVTPIPGCCAAITALSASGVQTSQYLFAGFLPAKSGERRRQLALWQQTEYAVVCYEAPHRIIDCLQDIVSELGAERRLILLREISKTFETIWRMPAEELLSKVNADANQRRGELVLIIDAAPKTVATGDLDEQTMRIISILAAELPTKQAAALAAKISGKAKNSLYDFALSLKN